MHKDNSNAASNKFFFTIGILAFISGIYLIFKVDYLTGISGAIVGGWFAFDNYKKIRNDKIG